MRTLISVTVLLGLNLVLATGTLFADKVKTDYDKVASFSQFKTYTFKPGLLMLADEHDRLNDHLFNAMRRELNGKGMTEVKENPDVFVTYFGTLGAISGGSGLYAPGQQARYDWGTPPGWTGIVSGTAVEGSLLIEMVNASTNQLAWRATVKGLLKNLGKPEKQGQKIDEVVKDAFRDYPPRGKR
jgi:Domain of unknown function (DUF4136)